MMLYLGPCGRTGPPSLSSVWLGTKVKRQQKPPPAPEDSQEGLLPVYVTYCLVDVSTTFQGNIVIGLSVGSCFFQVQKGSQLGVSSDNLMAASGQ